MVDNEKLTILTDTDRHDVTSIFGKNCRYDFNEVTNEWTIAGELENGVVEGGQNFKMVVHKSPFIYERASMGEKCTCWQLDNLFVNGINATKIIRLPLILASNPPELTDNPDYKYINFMETMDISIIPGVNSVLAPNGFSLMDQFIGLIHEKKHQNHSYSNENKLISEEYRIMANGAAGELKDSRDYNATLSQIRDRNLIRINRLKAGASLVFKEEVAVNQDVLVFFQNDGYEKWFNEDTQGLRLKKALTVFSLAYANNINILLGPNTVDPSLAEIK